MSTTSFKENRIHHKRAFHGSSHGLSPSKALSSRARPHDGHLELSKGLKSGSGHSTQKTSSRRPKLFIGGLHPFTTKHDLIETFSEFIKGLPSASSSQKVKKSKKGASKLISKVQVKINPKTGKNRGFAFFCVASDAIAHQIVQKDWVIRGRTLQVQYKNQKKTGDSGVKEDTNEKKRLFVSKINKDISDEDFKESFSVFDEVRAAYIIRDLDGYSKGYGFVDFFSEDARDAIVQHADERGGLFELKNQEVEVKPFRKKGRREKPGAVDDVHYKGMRRDRKQSSGFIQDDYSPEDDYYRPRSPARSRLVRGKKSSAQKRTADFEDSAEEVNAFVPQEKEPRCLRKDTPQKELIEEFCEDSAEENKEERVTQVIIEEPLSSPSPIPIMRAKPPSPPQIIKEEENEDEEQPEVQEQSEEYLDQPIRLEEEEPELEHLNPEDENESDYKPKPGSIEVITDSTQPYNTMEAILRASVSIQELRRQEEEAMKGLFSNFELRSKRRRPFNELNTTFGKVLRRTSQSIYHPFQPRINFAVWNSYSSFMNQQRVGSNLSLESNDSNLRLNKAGGSARKNCHRRSAGEPPSSN